MTKLLCFSVILMLFWLMKHADLWYNMVDKIEKSQRDFLSDKIEKLQRDFLSDKIEKLQRDFLSDKIEKILKGWAV